MANPHAPDRTDLEFWAVFDSAPDAYLLLAPDPPRFTIVAVNEARLRVTMTRREDIIGQPFFEIFPDNPDDPDATGVRNLTTSLNQVLRTGKPHRMAAHKYDVRKPDGRFEERYWEALNSPVFDDEGQLIYINHRVEDVTDRVHTRQRLERETSARAQVEAVLEKLRESEERHRLLATMIPQHIWTTDPRGYHRYFSQKWYDYTGARQEETNGDRWLRFVHPDDRERTLERWHHSVRTGEPYSIEYRFRNAAGEYHWFLGQAQPLRDESGKIIEWFGTLTDISERKQLDEERERLLQRERDALTRVSTLLESITDAFFAVDKEWRFTYLNRHAEELVERTRAQLIGHSLWEVFPSAVGSIFQREYRRAMAEQVTVRFEAYSPATKKWVDVQAYPAANGLSVFFRDVTARKEAEQKLRESERNFRVLANTIPQLAWMAAPSGWIFWYNDRFHDFTGTTPDEARGWGWRKILHPDHLERVVAKIRVAFEAGERWEDTFPLRDRYGEYRWFLSRAMPIKDAEGHVQRWFGTNTDITDQIQAAVERERLLRREQDARNEAVRQREELERVSESRLRLMRGFSHDVKNPLGAADGHAQLLEDGMLGELTPKQAESIQRIRRSIQSSLHLINELLELARAEAGQLELDCAPTDIVALVLEATEDYRAQANAAGLGLDIQLPDRRIVTRTDPERVRQILNNLLSNAVKYTHQGSITVRPDVRARNPLKDHVECIAIDVSDTGPGIAPDKTELIFQEFSRLDPEAKQGAGVGLAISRRIARIMGGDITVRSEVGQGSVFTVWLPLV